MTNWTMINVQDGTLVYKCILSINTEVSYSSKTKVFSRVIQGCGIKKIPGCDIREIQGCDIREIQKYSAGAAMAVALGS